MSVYCFACPQYKHHNMHLKFSVTTCPRRSALEGKVPSSLVMSSMALCSPTLSSSRTAWQGAFSAGTALSWLPWTGSTSSTHGPSCCATSGSPYRAYRAQHSRQAMRLLSPPIVHYASERGKVSSQGEGGVRIMGDMTP